MTTWIKNQPVAAFRRCALDVVGMDGAPAPGATVLTGLVFVRLGGTTWLPASGTITNATVAGNPLPGSFIYEATQAETNVDTNEIEVRVIDATWYAKTMVTISVPASVSLAPLIEELAGLLHRHSVLDNVIRTAGVLTSARLRKFSSAAACAAATPGAANGADGEVARYNVVATQSGGQWSSHRLVQVFP